ncbi:MAG: tRNA pseudouridine(38-40) synthase TruA [Pseudomonadota bacterium]
MPRYALKIEYDGRPFSGWQRQDADPSVQAALEAALAKLEPDLPSVAAAGRTDAGVHAWGQVAHCDMARDWDPFRLAEALNYHLKPAPIAIRAVGLVEGDWHARFTAQGRRYLYVIANRRAPLSLEAGKAWLVKGALEVEPMRRAARFLIGRHDFTTFRAALCQAKSPVKTLDAVDIDEFTGPGGARFEFRLRARSFLHSQVRSIVGTLERVGAGKWQPEDVGRALAAQDRAACGPVAPPDGLYLTDVDYPDDPFE